MRVWLASLTRGRALELALAFSLGYAAITFAQAITDVGVTALAQHAGERPSDAGTVQDLENLFSAGPYLLNFSVWGTLIFYGGVLSAALALGLVGLGGLLVIRKRDRELGVCPFCASRIPYESTHCAYCGSGVALGEP